MNIYCILYSRNLLLEEIFANHTVLLSEIFVILIIVSTTGDSYIANTEDIWIQKCLLTLIFANAFKIATLKDL